MTNRNVNLSKFINKKKKETEKKKREKLVWKIQTFCLNIVKQINLPFQNGNKKCSHNAQRNLTKIGNLTKAIIKENCPAKKPMAYSF